MTIITAMHLLQSKAYRSFAKQAYWKYVREESEEQRSYAANGRRRMKGG
jgi:hypothetical protein